MPRFKGGDSVTVAMGPLQGQTGEMVSTFIASAPREFALVVYQVRFWPASRTSTRVWSWRTGWSRCAKGRKLSDDRLRPLRRIGAPPP